MLQVQQWRHQVLQYKGANIWGPVNGWTEGMEGPKVPSVPSEAQRCEAPERRVGGV